MSRRFDLIVFDWDGTLSDSTGRIVDAMQDAISELGLPQRQNHEIATLIGLGLWEALAVLFPEHSREQLEPQLLAYQRRRGPAGFEQAPLFPQVEATLSQLAGEGVTLAVATGKGRQGLETALDASGLRHFFQATRTVDEAPSKPAPDMLEELLWETDTPAERALMIGDSEYDLAMARNARVASVGVLCGVHDAQTLRRCEPLGLLPHVAELPAWLDSTRYR
ncbi:HAD family hydrolase [Abyssibacter profundi]|uniref:HAD family hydrolase n=1 Tax=Abyssibacter profundi TaxID=2182787 RepID=A0A363UK87_9GAMM|nr:HAD-IA family hydrolase [Abyssibacter profundi]PWN55831.1 hypothetical protein DEH80_10450 [Abyssibacter profundi]